MATLCMADLHPTGGPEIWSSNQISISLASMIPILMDADGCPLETRPFPQPTPLLRKLVPLREHGIHNWSQRKKGRNPFKEGKMKDIGAHMW